MSFLEKNYKIFVAGHKGMVGSSICRLLIKNGYTKKNNRLLTVSREILDLKDSKKVNSWFKENKPDIVISAAAKVGGILANNNKPVDFLLENLKIQNNLIEASYIQDVKRFLFLGSSCIYPKFADQPIKEDYLLNSDLEKTNQWYAIAKIAGLKLCEAFNKQFDFDAISLMPTNMYGPNDNYNFDSSHVMASFIRKFYEAKKYGLKEVICWGSGKPLREFLYVDDFAEACFHALSYWSPTSKNAPLDENGDPLRWLNIGSDFEISIKDLAKKISEIIEYKGKISWETSKPDGTFRKKLCTKKINNLGWHAKTNLDMGISKTLKSFEKEMNSKIVRI